MNAPSASANSELPALRHAGGRPGLLWWLCATGLTISLALPFFLVDVPPVLDYPNHLARIFILARPDDHVLSQIYAPHWRILPNLGVDLLGAGLLKLTDVHIAGRLLLALCMFAPVIGVVIYQRAAFGRWELWPLASGIVACNATFLLGFMNFLLALGLAFAGASAWTVLRRRGAFATAIAVGAVASAATFFCHIFGVALLLLLIGAEESARLFRLLRAGRLAGREVARVAGGLAIAAAPAALLYFASPLSETAVLPGNWRGWPKLLAVVSPFMMNNFDLTLLTALGLTGFLLLSWRRVSVAPAFPISIAVLVLLFVVAPSTIKGGTFVDLRIMLMIALLLFAGLSPRITARSARMAGAFLAGLIVVRSGYVATAWIGHRLDLTEVRAAIAGVEPGARVLVARGHRGIDTDVARPTRALPGVYRLDGHLAALLAIERRAFWPLMFADPAQQPLDVLMPYKAIAQSPGEPVDLAVLQTDDRLAPSYIKDWRSKFDEMLLIDPPTPLPAMEGLAPVHIGSYAVRYRVMQRN